MDEMQNAPLDIFDSLASEDLSTVDTSFPVLAAGTYEFRIQSATVETSERTGGRYIALDLHLLSEDATSKTGEHVNPGYPLRHMISVTPTDKMDANQIKRNISSFMDAVIGQAARAAGTPFDPSLDSYLQQSVYVKTKIQPPQKDKETGEEYPERTVVSMFIPKE